APLRMQALFAQDGERVPKYSIEAAGIRLDYSRNLLTDEIRERLRTLAEQAGMAAAIEALFRGDAVNNTEHRPALLMALRSGKAESPQEREAQAALLRMESFVADVLTGNWRGYRGKRITDVVNI